MNYLVSVIVPVYKAELSIKKCAESILRQSYANIELFLVDDGSPDNSGKICDEIALSDSRVKVIHKPNGGPSSARNKGVQDANGDYLVFADADDWIDPDYVVTLLTQITTEKASIIMSGNTTHPFKVRDGVYQTFNRSQFAEVIESFKFFLKGDPWGKMFNASLIKDNEILFPDGVKFGEDLVFFYDALLCSDRIVYTSYSGYHYENINEDSLVSIYNSFEVEYKGYNDFQTVLHSFEQRYNIKKESLSNNYSWLFFFLMRSVKTVYKPGRNFLKRKERLSKIYFVVNNNDLSQFLFISPSFNWFDKTIFALLNKGMFRTLDCFLWLFYKSRAIINK